MNERQKKEVQVFNAALELSSPAERAAYLDQACAGDPSMREKVEALLRVQTEADGFFATKLDQGAQSPSARRSPFGVPPSGDAAGEPAKAGTPSAPTEKPGDRIGRYKLREKIGEGGCGVVYVADQEEPVRRRVALKIIKLGMDTRSVIARFEAERQALAMMDHPNIAKVFDAGMTEAPVAAGVSPAVEPGVRPGGKGGDISNAQVGSRLGPDGKMPPSTAGGTPPATLSSGRPYFVMELVRGIRITDYCDQNNLSTRERLDLFIKVCQAVQHAHQKGIIHRDLKPSNILVTLHDGVPVPKVIDFGIAKATEGRLTDLTIYTELHQFIGTPAYVSPEQAEMSGLDIDTRSDIYSLGVLLYELLTGQPPFSAEELLRAGFDEMRRTIREKEPARPSTRLSTMLEGELTATAKHRSADALKLIHLVRGDLDWIVMKSLEKDRTRRYATSLDFAADLQRHLSNEPVVARPPSLLYNFRKLVRRNKLVFTAAGGVVAALLVGVIGTTFGFIRANKHRRIAESAQHLAKGNFDQARAAVGDLLAVADDDLYDVPGMLPLRVKLMRAAIDRYKAFLDRPTSDPGPRADLARLYAKYGFAAAQIGADYEAVVIPAYQSALAIQQQLVSEHPENREMRSDLGYTFLDFTWGRDHNTVKAPHAEALAIFEALVRESPTDPLARADLGHALGGGEKWETDNAEYVPLANQRLILFEQLVREFPLSAEFRRDLANSLQEYARVGHFGHDAMLAMISRATDLRLALVADMEQHVPAIWSPLRPRHAAVLRRPSLLYAKRDVAYGCLAAADVHAQFTEWPEVIAKSDRAASIYRPLVEQNPSVGKFVRELRRAFNYGVQGAQAMGDTNGVQLRRLEAASFWCAHLPADDLELPKNLGFYTRALLDSGNYVEAEPFARKCLTIREKSFPDDWLTFNARSMLGASLLGQKKYAEAESMLLLGYEGMKQREEKIPAAGKVRLKEALQCLIKLCEATDRPDQAGHWKKKLTEFEKLEIEKKAVVPQP